MHTLKAENEEDAWAEIQKDWPEVSIEHRRFINEISEYRENSRFVAQDWAEERLKNWAKS